MISSITTATRDRILRQQIGDRQKRLEDSITSLSSGGQKRHWKDYGAESTTLFNLRTSINDMGSSERWGGLVEGRLISAENIISQLHEQTLEIKNRLSSAISRQDFHVSALLEAVPGDLAYVQRLMNAQEDGIYLFGGGAGDPPVDVSLSANPGISDPPNYGYYQGGAENLKVRLDDYVTLEYSILANGRGFERLIRGLQLLASSSTSDTYRFEAAFAALDEALLGFNAHTTTIGKQRRNLESIMTENGDRKHAQSVRLATLSAEPLTTQIQRFTDERDALKLLLDLTAQVNNAPLLGQR